ncbi:MAG TPA: GDSL-type esterase/lipase family protein [Microthrixaceae bacterium]|nr:GDSL-type esterase/lipase family protein [Microthrixaceae bacterium]
MARLLAAVAVASAVGVGVAGCGDDSDAGATRGDGEHKITVAGDSISVGLGSQLREVLADRDGGGGGEGGGDGLTGADDVVVKVIGEPGTGLARPDNFDWPTRLRALAADFPPDVLVFSVGSNDAQDLTDAAGDVVVPMSDEQAWDAEYSRRLAEVFDAFRPADGEDPTTRVVWVGHVRTARDDVADTNRRVHRLATEVAADRPWVEVRDLAALLGTGDTEATRCLLPDGLHLSVDCLAEADRALLGDLVAR